MNIDTKCLHSGYSPENGEPRVLPIYQSTTYKYDSTEHIQKLFDLTADGHMYSRISNPTVACVEEKIADLEGGVGALCTSSGQAASFLSILNICEAGENFIAMATIYGGTFNLFNVTLKKFGIDVKFVKTDATQEEIEALIDEKTRAIFTETITNPAIEVCDIEKFAKAAHANNIPLIVDNTFATPVLCRPIEWGADIVIHSTTKYMDGHATVVGGVIVDSGNFDWEKSGKFKGLTTPDESYHGLTYTTSFGKAAYITKARVQLMRDFGVYMQAQSAFLLNLGLETLPLRIEKHSKNAEKIAEFLNVQKEVDFVNYPTLADNKFNALAKKYLPDGCSGVIAFSLKGGREAAIQFLDNLKLATQCVHVADIRTCVLSPANSTHRQLSDEQLQLAGIAPGLIRLSCGCENFDDIIEDIKSALLAIK